MIYTYKTRQFISAITAIVCLATILGACSEWDEYKKYTKDGEIIYTGKFDSVVVFPGKERVRLWGIITRDPKVNKCKIFWNNFRDSVIFDIDGVNDDYIFDGIFDVEEGTKSFSVYTYDAAGNSSVGVDITGNSYGSRYRNTLSNRKIKSIAYDDAATTIYWDLIDKSLGPVEMEVRYKTQHGDTVVITPATETTTMLKGLDFGNEGFTWRTVFKPLPVTPNVVCIDTFCTKYSTRGIPNFEEKELDRSLFAAVSLPGDAGSNGGAGGVAAMWDGQAQNSYGGANFTDIGAGGSSPQMITFDLGMNVNLTKITLYPFQEWWGAYYVFSTIRDYEIYGSSNPTSSGALDESWTLLNAGTIEKPSGLPKDNEDAADKAAAVAGFALAVDSEAPKVRYIRIRCLRNYEAFFTGNDNAFFSIAEVKVSGMLPE
jgi:hypothetical protein